MPKPREHFRLSDWTHPIKDNAAQAIVKAERDAIKHAAEGRVKAALIAKGRAAGMVQMLRTISPDVEPAIMLRVEAQLKDNAATERE